MKICGVNLAALLLVLVIPIVIAEHNSSHAQRYCGSKLADVLKVLCKTKYNESTTKKPKKRDRVDTYARRYRVNYVDDGYDTIDYDPYGATGLLHTKRGQPSFVLATNKRLITDECCTKPCYVAELRTYCSG